MAANTIGSETFDYMDGYAIAAMAAEVREFERAGFHGKGMVGVGTRPLAGRKTVYKDFAPVGGAVPDAAYDHMDDVRALQNTIVDVRDQNNKLHEDIRVVKVINQMPKAVTTTADGDRFRVNSEIWLERTV